MSSHRGSIAINREGGLELYRASKAALDRLAHGFCGEHGASIHPGWAAARMGTLDGTVAIEVEPSVRGVADVVERHRGSGLNLYRDWEDRALDW